MKLEFNKKNIKFNNNMRVGIIIINIVVLLFIAYALLSTIKLHKYVSENVPVYSYASKGAVTYKVNLIPNSLYEQNALSENNTYISSYINNIDTNFQYKFSGDGPAEVKGKYNVNAVLDFMLTDDSGSKSIWSKKYVLMPETSFEGNDKTIAVPIDLQNYNNIAKQVMQESNVNFDTKLTVTYDVSIEAKTDKGVINEHLSPTMEIPLNTQFFQIKGNLTQEKSNVIQETKKIIAPDYKSKVIMYSIVMAVILILLVFLLIFTESLIDNDPIQKELKRIIKKHGDRFVAVNKAIDKGNNRIIEVGSMDDLVRVSDDVGKPILWNKSNTTDEPVFWVIDENVIYNFKIKCNTSDPILVSSGTTETV